MRMWLANARKEKGFKHQKQFAASIPLSTSYYNAIELGGRTPSGITAMKIARALDVPMERFYEEESKTS